MSAAIVASAAPLEYHELSLTKPSYDTSEEDVIVKCYDLMRSTFAFEQILNGLLDPTSLPLRDIPSILSSLKSHTGFVDNPYTSIDYSLLYVTSPGINIGSGPDIISTACIVHKNYSSPTDADIFSAELWSVSSNMLYMRTGAARFMINSFLLDSLRTFHTTGTKVDIYLEVDKESFPFITFYDRLLFYYKMGFDVVSKSDVSYITPDGNKGKIDLQSISIGYDSTTGNVIFTPDGTAYYSINEFKDFIPLIYPQDTKASAAAASDATATASAAAIFGLGAAGAAGATPIIMKYIYPDESIRSLLTFRLRAETYRHSPSSRSRTLMPISTNKVDGNSYCALFHSNYKLSTDLPNTFETKKVPPGVEVIIINSPGFYTASPMIRENWDFCQRFLQHVSIDVLKTIFRGIQPISVTTPTGGIEQRIPAPSASGDAKDKIAYMKAIQQNLLFHFPSLILSGGTLIDSIIQFQCYGTGDLYPELELGTTLGVDELGNPTSSDFVASIHGLFDITSKYKADPSHQLRLLGSSEPIPPEPLRFATPAAARAAATELGFPNRTPVAAGGKLLFPLLSVWGNYRISSNYSTGALERTWGEYYKINLSDLINIMFARDEAHKPGKPKRIFIVSCGNVQSSPVNDLLQRIAHEYIGRKINISMGHDLGATDYRNHLNMIGNALRITTRAEFTRRLSINNDPRIVPNNRYTALVAAGASSGGASAGGGITRKRRKQKKRFSRKNRF